MLQENSFSCAVIIYSNIKSGFFKDLPNIASLLKSSILEKLGEDSSEGEILSWKNSLQYIANILDTNLIPDDAGIALEYNIPITNNRIDFIISGLNSDDQLQLILIELKQWQQITPTDKDGIVITQYRDGLRETTHPSYQAVSYASLLYDYKEAVQNKVVCLHPCAFLHNYVNDGALFKEIYAPYFNKAKVFCKGDEIKLRDFILSYIHKGDRQKSIFAIENSKVVPSKSLIDCVVKMAEGIPEFKMVDDQKVAYQNILWAYNQYILTGQKQVVIIEGGPGTGKSVIAIKALVEMTRKKLLAHYITKNAAPRNVLYSKFMGVKGVHSSIKYLFKSSGIYYDKNSNEFDMLLADEAHRLQEHSGIYGNLGENQMKEIINAAKVSVFFIDEKQIVSLSDIGSISAIEDFALQLNANISRFKLTSQFRCSGSDEYMMWLDHLFQYDHKKPFHLSGTTYEFHVLDSPEQVMREIKQKNKWRNKSRMVAGYCWPWVSKKNPKAKDIIFNDCDFAYQWNLASDKIWSISKGSIEQIGCIHTCQGLEFEYVGVIIGNDLLCRNGEILVNPANRATDDFSVRGWKQRMTKNPEETKNLIRMIIKNTYRTLMTRGMKGCFIYACDSELQQYIKQYAN